MGKIQSNRTIALLAGLALVLVPTLFSVFSEWTEWDTWLRVLVVVGWFGAAAIVVTSAVRQGARVEDLLGTAQARRDKARVAAANRLLRAVLSPPGTGLEDHEFRLFVPDEKRTRLVPAFESDGLEDSAGWQVGRGATGVAWARNSWVLVTGDAVSDGTYGLSEEQQRRYSDLAVVAAMPVQNARGEPIAVLSVSSTVAGGPSRDRMGRPFTLSSRRLSRECSSTLRVWTMTNPAPSEGQD